MTDPLIAATDRSPDFQITPDSLPDAVAVIRAAQLFNEHVYREQISQPLAPGVDALVHYLQEGERAGFRPNQFFDPQWYHRTMMPSHGMLDSPLYHYAVTGKNGDTDPSQNFSAMAYLHFYGDVAAAGVNPLQHYLTSGQAEGRVAFPRCDSAETTLQTGQDLLDIRQSGLLLESWYLAQNFTLYGSGVDPLVHYYLFGEREGLKPNPYFDPDWYRARYCGDDYTGLALTHYIRTGSKAGHWPSAGFSPQAYLDANADLAESAVEALGHYLLRGRHEGRPLPLGLADRKSIQRSGPAPLSDDPLSMMTRWQENDLRPPSAPFNPSHMTVHWIVPDFAPGAGGHMTIFRMMHYLAHSGHTQTLWIHSPSHHQYASDAFATIQTSFQQLFVDVRFLDDTLLDIEADAVIATDCFSVWPALAVSKVRRRFYFVQDLEAEFHALGARSIAAEATYHRDLDCICASPWLADVMTERYGRWARPFHLAADPAIYSPPPQPVQNARPHIAVYARHFTERRLVEFALLGLNLLAARGLDFHVDFFGADLSFRTAPYSFTSHGVCSPAELATIFQNSDIGMVFSATNYSLVPQEMMACGLPVVEFDGPNTRAIFPDGVVAFAKPDPKAIADQLKSLITSEAIRRATAEAGAAWVADFSWRKSADMVEAALQDRLTEVSPVVKDAPAVHSSNRRASVVIPTLNAGPDFPSVLAQVQAQQTSFDFDILVIDSGSDDGTTDHVRAAGVRLLEIDKADFNHGDTRNLGAAETDGEYIAFLTHDARPTSKLWLAMMVEGLDKTPNAAGVIGRHYPWANASPFTKRDLHGHFDLLAEAGLLLNRDTNRLRYDRGDEPWLQLLHFYSDNNSMMRRSVWKDIPYRRTKFGEDQLWARDIIDAGYSKLYLPNAAVYHSHDYDAAETEDRNRIEAAFFKHFFGYKLMESEAQLDLTLQQVNALDTAWAEDRNVPAHMVEERLILNAARLRGLLRGTLADTEGMF